MKKYRDNGAVGALLDEYERAISELSDLLDTVSPEQLSFIVDTETEDEDCRSIQTIMTHVVSAGYNYATTIRNRYTEKTVSRDKVVRNSIHEYKSELIEMFRYTENVFSENLNLPIEEMNAENKMLVSWGQLYDIDQLMEHAIVHILRHRRQIERFLLRIK